MSPKSFDSRGRNGFASVVVLSAMVPIMVLASYSILRLAQLNDLRWLRETCRQTLIPTQRQVAGHLGTLLNLNVAVRELKAEKVVASAALAVAIANLNAPAAQAARNWLASIRSRQVAVRVQQNGLIRLSELAMVQAKTRIESTNQIWSQRDRPIYTVHLHSPAVLPQRLAVRTRVREEFPEYELVPRFSEEQALELKWLVEFRGKARGERKWRPFDYKIPERCGVTLVEHRGSFEIKLHQDKFFWSL